MVVALISTILTNVYDKKVEEKNEKLSLQKFDKLAQLIRDSVQVVVTKKPDFSIAKMTIIDSLGQYYANIHFWVKNAPVHNLNLKIGYCFRYTTEETEFEKIDMVIFDNKYIPENLELVMPIIFPKGTIKNEIISIQLVGNYKEDANSKIVIPIDRFYSINSKTHNFSTPTELYEQQFRDKINTFEEITH